ncbi:hypothetical protein KYK30_31910 [Shinella yambaruensis]|uniref:Transcriptional regulator n=1 Tax=Shinella yambaruensis TaxID=415996 RepID=A0ABQ5ZUU6_9HYPH|nr:hypothetical protein [Shinella yambaruensis]MCJ8030040.1 hypothetical protein [Shinella yambaruensis]MCU7984332.1 hypothetical protein [Shinella yambaruensis]GLR55160.1 hypothetical protein GCM10007923_63810 [Shinella yambaruensis]
MNGQSKYERKRLQAAFRKGVKEGRRLEREARQLADMAARLSAPGEKIAAPRDWDAFEPPATATPRSGDHA